MLDPDIIEGIERGELCEQCHEPIDSVLLLQLRRPARHGWRS
jgi:hypothetical protein